MDTENKKIMRRVIIIFICSILAPIAMDYFILGNSFPSNIDNDTWAGFLGSYIGGIATIVVFYLTILHTNEQNHRIEQRQRLEDKENRRLLIMPYIETRYDIVRNLQRERDNLRVFKMSGAKVEHVKTTLSDVDKKFMGLKNIESNYYLEYKLINAGAGNAVNMNIFVNGFKTDFTLLKNESGYLFLMINFSNNDLPIDIDIELDYWDIELNGHYKQSEKLSLYRKDDELVLRTVSKEPAKRINFEE